MNYGTRVERATTAMGASFVAYRPSTGTWIFDVEHFSKYGIKDDDEEENVAKVYCDELKKFMPLFLQMPRLAQSQPHASQDTSALGDEHNLSADTVRLMGSIEKASRLIVHAPQQAPDVSYMQQDIKPSILYDQSSMDYSSKTPIDQSRQVYRRF